MQIITPARYHHTLTRMARIQRRTSSDADKDVEPQELSFSAGGNAKWRSHCGRQFGSFIQNYTYSYHITAVVLFDIYLLELITSIHTKSYTWMFGAVLFIIAKTLKQRGCPSIGEWIK